MSPPVRSVEVVGDFPDEAPPSSPMTTTSMNLPPVSTPIMYFTRFLIVLSYALPDGGTATVGQVYVKLPPDAATDVAGHSDSSPHGRRPPSHAAAQIARPIFSPSYTASSTSRGATQSPIRSTRRPASISP